MNKISRWDTHAHRLADFTESDPSLEIFPGQDYSDARLRDFEQGKNMEKVFVVIVLILSMYSERMGYEIN